MNEIYRVIHPYHLTEVFHQKFDAPVRLVPATPSAAERLLRVKLVMEEAMEFVRASGFDVSVCIHPQGNARDAVPVTDATPDMTTYVPDIVEAADGLADLNVVVNGSGLVWGFPMPALDNEIYRSNMSKLGADGKVLRSGEGKILKGPNYFRPDVRRVLLDHGWMEGT